ncbi:Vomeronasal type-2 receptor 26 [Cricetulus griseus]|uniref:Vomeronasal type-2 receptor 26 n=1 Tax=Cricetulus griseus TaxID=10029 RepID=G3I329_CRIGR|nr:Vomeronasal type-2 receptor 26 [Cricetulus griseus]
MTGRNLAVGLIFLSQTTFGLLGNSSVFYNYILLYFTRYKLNSTDWILNYLVLANFLTLLCKGVPQTMAAFGLNTFITDFGCKLLFYLHKIGRGTCICSSSFMSVFQAITISCRDSRGAEFKNRTFKHNGLFLCFCCILNILMSIYNLLYMTQNLGYRNMTSIQNFGYCPLYLDKTGQMLHAVFLPLPDAVWVGLMIPQSVCSESCAAGFRKVAIEGKAVCCYDCIPCPDNEITNDTDMDQCMKCPESQYANTEKKHCLQKVVSFLDYKDPLGMSLTTIALCFSVLTAMVLGLFVKNRDTPIVKANNRTLSYTLLITLIICFLCTFLFIGCLNTTTCILQQITFGGAFTVALATVLAKAITVVIAFKVTFPSRVVRWLMISKAPNYIIPICTVMYLVLCAIWLGTSPPFLDQDAHAEHGHIIIVCNKGSAFAFHGVLGYLCFLALGSYTMAFLSRNLPDTFNEAKFLSFSMLVFFCVWVTFLPVYHSTKGKVMVAMEVFSILASSAALLGLIFAPKCYIILRKPNKNSLHHIRNRTYSRMNNFLKT